MLVGTKQEYNLANGAAVLDGSTTANAALMRATLALDRIERHEEECKRRWGLVVKLMLVALTKLGGLTMFLVADKLGWLS
ncbi:hypothetical protein [Kordiimonas pumila]|uniref:Uncharacterized protein n=1 Tax=Kordiimonas pumila TaxID=2161677 RepID=A0ABV7D3E0_9PROT|nr:hypothetical protein [Kordiimonas pumila]